jgi:hypothetical protein
MKPQWIAALALVAGLLATSRIALADQFLPDDESGVPVCVTAAGLECTVESTDSCTKYTIVHVKIGTETVISRQCSERTVKTTYLYWKTY